MKNSVILFVLGIMVVTSCSKENSRIAAVPKNETDKVILKDNDIKSFSRYSGDRDPLIDKIYYKLIENDEKLKKLDEDIYTLQNESREYNRSINDILEKPKDYYNDALQRSKQLKDSILKKEMIQLIESSEKNFKKNTSSLNEKMKSTSLHSFTINELYNVYKIRKTIPAIEEFQKNIPNSQKIDSIISTQQKIIEELKKLKK